MCCRAFTAECLACSAGQTEAEYCAQHSESHVCAGAEPPAPVPPMRPCCRAFSLDCLACAAGQSNEDYCASNPSSHVCAATEATEAANTPLDSETPDTSETVCCRAFTIACLACSAGLTEDQYCEQNPGFHDCAGESQEAEEMEMEEQEAEDGPVRFCCQAMSAPCMACMEGVTEDEYCLNHPDSELCGDRPAQLIARPCCMALTADCLACAEGLTVEQLCATNPETAGCPSDEDVICCEAMTAKCLACSAGVEVAEYCGMFPGTDGCSAPPSAAEPRICCMAMTLNCLACGEGVTQSEYCANHPEFEGCPVAA